MSGHVDTTVGTKKIVRYYVCGESHILRMANRHFKKKDVAELYQAEMISLGYADVRMYTNTRIFKTERTL